MDIRKSIKRMTGAAVWVCMIGILAFFVICRVHTEVLAAELVRETEVETGIEAESGTESEILPEELDLGDYQSEMQPGDRQLLTVTVLPLDASNQEITYTSSEPAVATINGMGRITAVQEGETRITAACGQVIADFILTVRAPEEDVPVKVTELDLGDCPKEITVGMSQILSVGTIPANATETELTFHSGNPAVATVNALGRVTGMSVGSAVITVSCGEVSGTFTLQVVAEKVIEENKVPVQDIEIGEYEEELEVDKTVSLSATVLPSDAVYDEITYRSSNTGIATVKSSGEVKGIAPGEVIIYVSAGGVTKEVPITVKIGTTVIALNSDYRIMKPGDTFQIEASVQPEGAAGAITYKSLDTAVAEVTAEGLITAKASGNTAVVVANGDIQTSVTVIVNETGSQQENGEGATGNQTEAEDSFPVEVDAQDYPVISSDMLKYLYEKEKCLTVKGNGYTIYLNGKDIVNYENELSTSLNIREEENGFSFTINDGNKLCGEVTLDISEKVQEEKYVYLYNQTKEKYELLQTENIKQFTADVGGTYLLTSKKENGFNVNVILIGVGAIAVLIGVGVYIGVKKRYWFW